MYDIMRKYATDNVWCSPWGQDNQSIIAPARLTKDGGDIVSTRFMLGELTLPKRDTYYHLYQVGQISPVILGLFHREPAWSEGQWRSFQDVVNMMPLFVDINSDDGIHLPLQDCYYKFTKERALVVAFPVNPGVDVDMNRNRIYMRFYTNRFYDDLPDGTHSYGSWARGNMEIVNASTILAGWKQEGNVFSYVNGVLVDKVDLLTVKLSDRINLVKDTSVKRVVNLKIRDLIQFRSELDSCFKYLIHYPETIDEAIDFIDDVDVYVTVEKDGQTYGRYLHHNRQRNLRQVTHRDYSVPVDNVQMLVEALKAQLNYPELEFQDANVRLYIRNSGYNRPLVFSHDRLHELYKLSDTDVRAAMVGMDSLVPFWRADVLEQSNYIKMMRSREVDLTTEVIEDGFGYNAISKVIGGTPSFGLPYNGKRLFELPVGLTNNVTVFEYDAEGLLLGYYHVVSALNYVSQDDRCVLIEAVSGQGTHEPCQDIAQQDLAVPEHNSFRLYHCYNNEYGEPLGDWQDVTDTGRYTVENGLVKWEPDSQYSLLMRTDEKFLCFSFEMRAVAGTLVFDLTEKLGDEDYVMPLPCGDLDVFLNGHSCIEGLDVFVDFPKVSLVCKDYLVQPAGSAMQQITVRFTGFAENTPDGLKLRKKDDYGFIDHAVLSNNYRYNIRDDKVIRIVVKGRLHHRSEVTFSEEHEGSAIIDELNGKPYQVKDVIVPLKEITSTETYQMRQLSLARDKAVSDYMTLKLPQPERGAVSAMYERHCLFSPFLSHLINDLNSGQFDMSLIQKEISDQDVLEICKPYEYLLNFDPMVVNNGVDQRYVVIHPHQLTNTIALGHYAYIFIKRVVALYANQNVVLAQHVVLNKGVA